MPTASACRLPSAADIIASNESKQLYRTNLLRLQLDELHLNLSPVYGKLVKVEKLISDVSEAVVGLKQVTIPIGASKQFPDLIFRSDLSSPMEFRAPISIEVVGSYKQKSIVKPLQNIDVAITISKSCFGAKDFKAGRYFDRRTAYCAELCRQLSLVLSMADVSVDYWQSDTNRAIVVLAVPNSLWRINLIPCLESGTFAESKLAPDYCNLKESTECDPLYNASILADMNGGFFADSKTICSGQNFAKAIQLVKVWLYRRNALISNEQRCGCLSGFHISLLLAHISTSQSVPREASAYQLFKLFLALLSSTRWGSESIVYGSKTTTKKNSPYIEIQLASTIYNPFWNVPLFLMEELSVLAAASLRVIDDEQEIDVYESLFCARSSNSADFELVLTHKEVTREIADEVFGVFKLGLKKRVADFSCRYSSNSITLLGQVTSNTDLVEKGPSADSAEARDFKAFWGAKAELRRFRDGSILECVVWDSSSNVVFQIATFLAGKFSFMQSQISVTPLASSAQVSVSLWSQLETLRTELTGIPSLPLSIVDLRPSDPRFTATSQTLGPYTCVAEFESSAAWPVGRLAVWHAKCAFLLAIRNGLLGNKAVAQVEVSAHQPAEPFLDVRMAATETVFRLFVFVATERVALERAMESSVAPTMAEIASVSQLWFLPTLRSRIHAMSIETPGICGAIQLANSWLDNHLLLEPYLGPWVECTMALVAGTGINCSSHTLMMNWLFFLANHEWKSRPLFVQWNNEVVANEKTFFDQALETRQAWWISSNIDPHCVYLRRPCEWEATRIQGLAKKALQHAASRQWEKIKAHTDNSAVFDLILTVNTSVEVAELVQVLTEQFRKYFSFHYSEVHKLIGVIFEEAAFAPQTSRTTMLTVVDNIAVPDVAALMAKLAAIVQGSVSNVKVRNAK